MTKKNAKPIEFETACNQQCYNTFMGDYIGIQRISFDKKNEKDGKFVYKVNYYGFLDMTCWEETLTTNERIDFSDAIALSHLKEHISDAYVLEFLRDEMRKRDKNGCKKFLHQFVDFSKNKGIPVAKVKELFRDLQTNRISSRIC